MPVETSSLFAQVIQDHLDLKERNSRSSSGSRSTRYQNEDPFENHPLFKTEEQARLEETMDGEVDRRRGRATCSPARPARPKSAAVGDETDSGLWWRSRDFDWGD